MDFRHPFRSGLIAPALFCLGLVASDASPPPAAGDASRQPRQSPPIPLESLAREQALALALQHHPALAAAGWSVEAAEGRVVQARLRPNPEVEVEAEDIGSPGGSGALGGMVTTVRLGQVLELGGKRAARSRLAGLERNLSEWDRLSLREDVRRDTAVRFAAVLAAQERVRLLKESCILAEGLLRTVADRVGAGKDSPVELSKARVAVANRRVELRRAEQTAESARIALASQWGAESADFRSVAGDLASIPELAPLEALVAGLEGSPDLGRWSDEVAQRAAALAVARSGRVPDVTVTGGAAYARGEDDASLVVSASVPLPFFDRNQGAVREAMAVLRQADEQRRAVYLELRTALVEHHQAFLSARQEALSRRDEILPETRRALELAEARFVQGKTAYLDVLDAQQTLFESQMQYAEALEACHTALAQVERLSRPADNR